MFATDFFNTLCALSTIVVSAAFAFDNYKSLTNVQIFSLGIINAFGGGAIIRDLIILKVSPGVLQAPNDICIYFLFTTMMLLLCRKGKIAIFEKNIFWNAKQWLERLEEAIFLIVGLTKAFDLKSTTLTIIACGTFTAVGGGTIVNIMQHGLFCGIWKRREKIATYMITSAFILALYKNNSNKTLLSYVATIFCYTVMCIENIIKRILTSNIYKISTHYLGVPYTIQVLYFLPKFYAIRFKNAYICHEKLKQSMRLISHCSSSKRLRHRFAFA